MIKIIFITFLFSFSLVFSAQNKKVYLEVELEDVVGATEYEVEYKLQTSDKKENVSKSHRQIETFFKLPVEAGNYSVRTRSISVSNQSDWSEWFVLTALPEPPTISQSLDNQHFTSKKIQKAEIPLSWGKTEGADKYQIIIQNLDNHKIETLNTIKNTMKLKLEKGRFRVGLQSISKNKIKSEVVYYPGQILITDKKLERIESTLVQNQEIHWKNNSHKNINIDVYVKRFFSDEFVFFKTYAAQTQPWKIPQDLKPGEYQFRLQALSDELENSEIETHQLSIKPKEKDFKQQF